MQTRSPAAVISMEFDPSQGPAAQIARLAATLPSGAMPRLERLQGFGTDRERALTCICSRIALEGTEAAILVVATERAGPDLPLADRLTQTVGALDEAAAAFSAQGELLAASRAGHDRLKGATDIDALGAQALAQQASRAGHAQGRVAAGDAKLDRLNAGNQVVLLMTLEGDEAVAPKVAAPSIAAQDAPPAPPAPAEAPRPLPRGPLMRFVWQSDADHRFVVESDDFLALAGWKTKGALGSPWSEFATALGLDAGGHIAAAFATHATWTAIPVQWPVDGTNEHVTVELSGLPVFDREHAFQGYRGFGVCRDVERLKDLAQQRAHAETAAKAEAEAATAAEAKARAEAEAKAQAEAAAKAAEEKAKAEREAASRQAEAASENGSANVVPFRPQPQEDVPTLDPREQSNFGEIARQLSDRLKKSAGRPINDDDFGPERHEPIAEPDVEAPPILTVPAAPATPTARDSQSDHAILDRLPVGILVYRLNDLLYANRAFLEWTDYPDLEALRTAGGLDSLFIETNAAPPGTRNAAPSLTITTPGGKRMPVEGRLFPTTWAGENSLVLMLNITKAADKSAGLAVRKIEDENRELKAILDTATDGVLLIDQAGRVLSANRSAQALFGYDADDFTQMSLGELFAPESRGAVIDYLNRLSRENAIAVLNEGREVIGRVRQGGLVPLYLTIGRAGENGKFCAVFRDVTAWKKTEEDLIKARQQAENASAAKSEFLAKISHEIRTPLNAIIGFSEVMLEERFGAIGNDRYKQYIHDIHTSGGHLISLVNDLLDLSKIEAGKLELTFTGVNLNDIAQQCVAILQEQANRDRVIIRTSLPPTLPQIVADARSVRQIVLNLLSNSIKFTGAGGQVIVSTALTDRNEVVLRVRDTGAGMSPHEIEAALEPFRQLATATRWGANGTGLGLPITKALAEANHATFSIKSAQHDGTLVEIAFPAPRILAR